MNTEKLLKKLLDAGYTEDEVDYGTWGYYSPCNRFAVYYSVRVKNGVINSDLSAYYNPQDQDTETGELSREDGVTPDEVWDFVNNHKPRKKVFTDYEFTLKVRTCFDSMDTVKKSIKDRLLFGNDIVCELAE